MAVARRVQPLTHREALRVVLDTFDALSLRGRAVPPPPEDQRNELKWLADAITCVEGIHMGAVVVAAGQLGRRRRASLARTVQRSAEKLEALARELRTSRHDPPAAAAAFAPARDWARSPRRFRRLGCYVPGE